MIFALYVNYASIKESNKETKPKIAKRIKVVISMKQEMGWVADSLY